MDMMWDFSLGSKEADADIWSRFLKGSLQRERERENEQQNYKPL